MVYFPKGEGENDIGLRLGFTTCLTLCTLSYSSQVTRQTIKPMNKSNNVELGGVIKSDDTTISIFLYLR